MFEVQPKSDFFLGNWLKVCEVKKLDDGDYSIDIYDKTKDLDLNFSLYTDGTLMIESSLVTYIYLKKISNNKELEKAISDYSDDIRGHSSGLWLNSDDLDD